MEISPPGTSPEWRADLHLLSGVSCGDSCRGSSARSRQSLASGRSGLPGSMYRTDWTASPCQIFPCREPGPGARSREDPDVDHRPLGPRARVRRAGLSRPPGTHAHLVGDLRRRGSPARRPTRADHARRPRSRGDGSYLRPRPPSQTWRRTDAEAAAGTRLGAVPILPTLMN